jgi:hypothetical protein
MNAISDTEIDLASPMDRQPPLTCPCANRTADRTERISVTVGGPGGLLPCMEVSSRCASHVATRVAMGGLNRPVLRTAEVLRRAPTPSRPLGTVALLAVLLVLAACSNAVPADEPEPSPDPTVDSAPSQPADASEPDAGPPGAEELAATWEAFHAAWVEQAAAPDPDPAAFEASAADPQGVVELLRSQRGEGRLVTTEVELWPRFEIEDDRAEVTDCAIVAQHPDGQPDSLATVTIGWEATAVATDDGWRIDSARPLDLFCIAEELNLQLVDAYGAWLDGHDEWYDPPDPDHPLLSATMADPGLTDMRAILADDRAAGISMRFPHEPEAAVTEIGLGTARVTDCYVAPDGYGAFDVESGERRPDVVPAPEAGQLNRTVADIERTDEGWRVTGWRWEEQNNCEPRETRYAVS